MKARLARLLAMAATATAVTFAAGPVLAQSPDLKSKSQAAGRLEAQLQKQGWVRVIVQFGAPMAANALAGDQASYDGARRSIAAARETFLKELNINSTREVRWGLRRFSHVPFVAMNVNAAELKMLAAHKRVARIWEDELNVAYLDKSVPHVFSLPAGATPSSGTGGKGVTVAVLDSGVDSEHPFLKGRVEHEACFSSTVSKDGQEIYTSFCPNRQPTQVARGAGMACPKTVEGCDHGTHVAGIVAGRRGSDEGPPMGVAPEAKIFAVQVFTKIGDAARCQAMGHGAPCVAALVSDQIAALEYLASVSKQLKEPLAAINMSLGGPPREGSCPNDPRAPVFALLASAGIPIIVASGNSGSRNEIGAPACVPNAIPVGATNLGDEVTSFSNMSPLVALMAPGFQIYSSTLEPRFQRFNGTSMAAPHVAGAVAVLKAAYPKASAEQIIAALKSTGVAANDQRPDGKSSAPRIRIGEALKALGAGAAAAAPAPPPAKTAAPVAPAAPAPPSAPARDPAPAPAPAPAPVAQPPAPAPAQPPAGCKDPAEVATDLLKGGADTPAASPCK